MGTNILVTGSTGNVGREVVRLLSVANYPVTAAVRNSIESQKSFGSNVRYVLFDFTSPDTFTAAFAGINKLFLVRPPATCSRQRFAIADLSKITPALSAAKRSDIEEIVFLSFIWQMLQQGFPFQFVLVMVGIYTTARFGLADLVTSDV